MVASVERLSENRSSGLREVLFLWIFVYFTGGARAMERKKAKTEPPNSQRRESKKLVEVVTAEGVSDQAWIDEDRRSRLGERRTQRM